MARVPDDPPISYSFRHHAFVGEATWRIMGDALVREMSGATLRFPLGNATELRMAFAPTRAAANRYGCTIRFRGGLRFVLVNLSYLGMASFEDRSADYVRFVRALAGGIGRANPTCRFHAGKPRLTYALEMIFVGSSLVLLAAVLWLTLEYHCIGSSWRSSSSSPP